jgi:hypothetical protein
MKIRQVGVELFHADGQKKGGQTGSHDKPNSHFSQLFEHA